MSKTTKKNEIDGMTPEMKKISKFGNPGDILDGMDKLDTLANRKGDLERRKRDLKTWKSRKGDSGWWAHPPSSMTNNQSEKKITNLKDDINNNKQKIDKLQNRMNSLEDQLKKNKKTKRGLFRGGRKGRSIVNPFRPTMASQMNSMASQMKSKLGLGGSKRKKTRKQKRKSRTRRRR